MRKVCRGLFGNPEEGSLTQAGTEEGEREGEVLVGEECGKGVLGKGNSTSLATVCLSQRAPSAFVECEWGRTGKGK